LAWRPGEELAVNAGDGALTAQFDHGLGRAKLSRALRQVSRAFRAADRQRFLPRVQASALNKYRDTMRSSCSEAKK
jgi:hypothetical protein